MKLDGSTHYCLERLHGCRKSNVNYINPFINVTHTLNPPQNKNKTVCIAKADSGASNHFWREEDVDALHDIRNEDGPPVKITQLYHEQ